LWKICKHQRLSCRFRPPCHTVECCTVLFTKTSQHRLEADISIEQSVIGDDNNNEHAFNNLDMALVLDIIVIC